MRLGRRESFALGELALFLMAWMLAMVAALDDYAGRSNAAAKNNVAATEDLTETHDSFD